MPHEPPTAAEKLPEYLIPRGYLEEVVSIDPIVDSEEFVRQTEAWFKYLESKGIDYLDYIKTR